jgi:hypothetical protein
MDARAQAVAKIMQRKINPEVNFKPPTVDELAVMAVDRIMAPPTEQPIIFDKSSTSLHPPGTVVQATGRILRPPGKAAVPSLLDEVDSESEQDVASAFRVAPSSSKLPEISDDDEDEPTASASSAAPKQKAPKPARAPKAPKVPETEEEKAERKRLKEEERAETKRKDAIEMRRQLRVEAGELRADALSAIDGKVPLGGRWQDVDAPTRLKRAKLVPGALNVRIKRKVLCQDDYLPPGLEHDEIGRTVYVPSKAAKTAGDEQRAFLEAASHVKWRRVGVAQQKLSEYLAAKNAAAAAAAAGGA